MITTIITAAVATSAILLAALPAMAVDGETLIDQAKVNAGGVSPGDTAGFPARLSRPGRYKLSSNLTVPGGTNGIEVTANNVTLDLNGFTIRSSSPNVIDNAVQAIGVSGLKVLNGTISGFSAAIYNFQGRYAVVDNMRMLSNADGLITDSDAIVRNSTIVNGTNGIDCSENCLIEQNVITGHIGIGIRVTEGAVVLANVIAGNRSFGLAPDFPRSGYGNNVLVGNNMGGTQVKGVPMQLHPNACDPACP